jgi:RimJ/RimL family protein N-acetyltransferase
MVLEKDEVEDDSLLIDCPVLVTERLVLRPPHEDDLADLVALAGNRSIAEMLARMPHPYGEAEALAFIAGRAAKPGECQYAIALADSGAFIGAAGLQPSRHAPGSLEIGYWIGEPHWGMGYATEAAHALVDLAFRATDIEVLHASCRLINPASRRVIQKCGFQHAGQGMIDSLTAGRVAVERYTLDRGTWVSLKSWAQGG